MTDLLIKFIRFVPKRWRNHIVYGISFLMLLVIEVLWQIERIARHFITFLRQQKSVARAGLAAFALLAVILLALSLQSPGKEPEVIAYSSDSPSEIKPDESFAWLGEAEDPKKISIPSIGADGFIQKVGKDQHEQIAVPNNIYIAGWFVDSARPGQKGLSIIDGHVDGRSAEGGVFKRLAELKEGQEFVVELGNGTMLNYHVLSTLAVPTEEAASALFSQHPKVTSQLNLITCGGSYDQASRDYDKRIIVAAVLIE